MITRRSFFATGALAVAAGCISAKGAASKACPRADVYTTGKASFKLGFAPYTYNKYEIDQILDFARALDIKYTGIKYFMVKKGVGVEKPEEVRSITDAEIAAFKDKLAKAGVTASSVGPVYMETEEQCRAAFEFTKRMGLKVLVAVPYEFTDAKRKHRVASRKLCEYAAKCCKEFDILYAIHNHGPDSPDYFPTGRSAYEMVQDLDSRMGLCLDIGHDFRFGYDPVDSIRRYGDRLFDVHLKNVTDCTKKGRAMVFPRGKIDLVGIAKALQDIGYTGVCEIEYERDFTDNFAAMCENVGYFRGIMDSLR
ncbi:MAG: sugar phosphate isomerase/epimerase [Kiritimatiellae bacterium]|nr:sugar phosphate isomerase/epimerase [Kiritimatiellia bacterium]